MSAACTTTAEEKGVKGLDFKHSARTKVPLFENVKHQNFLGSMTDFQATQYPDKI